MTTILVDTNNVMCASYFAAQNDPDTYGNDEKFALWRLIFLKMILDIKRKFEPVDEVVLCNDSRNSWRKDFFQYYKARRVLKKQDSDMDWDAFYAFANETLDEMRDHFPYKIVTVDRAEGDDVIAAIVCRIHKTKEAIVVVSRDKDYFQLCRYKNVSIYNPIENKFIKDADTECPFIFAANHILKGDSGDDIPNLLSEDNIFLQDGKRQKSITQKVIKEFHDIGVDEFVKKYDLQKNYERNRKMVILDEENIPEEIVEKSHYEYLNQETKNSWMLVNKYLRKYQIRRLFDSAGFFCIGG